MKHKSSSSPCFRDQNARRSGCITLLTDFGLSDAYVGAMKGVIARINPHATVIDLCHEVAPQNIKQAAFLLASSYAFFPAGAIHVAVVDPAVGGKRRALCVKAGDFFFIGPDNGVLSYACSLAGIEEIRALENEAYFLNPRSRTFHGRDVFAPAAAHLSAGARLQTMGRKLRSLKQISPPSPEVAPGRISGVIVHVDRFGNLITNISREAFAGAFPGGASEKMIIRIGAGSINGLSETYCDVAPGTAAALFGSYDLLEIAIRGGSAAATLGTGEGAEVIIAAPEYERKTAREGD